MIGEHAVDNGVRSAGIVGETAPQSGAVSGGRVGADHQAVGRRGAVDVPQYCPRFGSYPTISPCMVFVYFVDFVEIARTIENQSFANGLPGQ